MFNRPRGTKDLFGEELDKQSFVISALNQIAKKNCFQRISTPVYEDIGVFVRSIGESSDIVKKEFFNFKDKGEREIVLRPEGTAGVVRAVVENKLLHTKPLPLRLYYCSNMYRYERPQSGREREFVQFGIEMIGTNAVVDDALILSMAIGGLEKIGLKQTTDFKVLINNIGTAETRAKWIAELKKYFKKYTKELTKDSIERIETNPLRILDDKVDGKKPFVLKAPKIDKYLSEQEKEYWKQLISYLKEMKIEYEIDSTLVRGLDYYTNFVFELVSTNKKLSGQSTICGGGRYNKLVKEFSGTDCECVGYAWGVTRIMEIIDDSNSKFQGWKEFNILETCPTIILASLGKACDNDTFQFSLKLSGMNVITLYDTKPAKAFSLAEKLGALSVGFIGINEKNSSEITIKNQITLKQTTIQQIKAPAFLKEMSSKIKMEKSLSKLKDMFSKMKSKSNKLD